MALTDNRNRTVAEIRASCSSKHGGNMGEAGCVAWMFHKRGVIAVDKSVADEERLMEVALDAGADDVTDAGDVFEITTAPETLRGREGRARQTAGIATATRRGDHGAGEHGQPSAARTASRR